MRSNLIYISYKHLHNNEHCITKEAQLTKDSLSKMLCGAVFQNGSNFHIVPQGSNKYYSITGLIF